MSSEQGVNAIQKFKSQMVQFSHPIISTGYLKFRIQNTGLILAILLFVCVGIYNLICGERISYEEERIDYYECTH